MTAIPYLFSPGKRSGDRRSYGFDFGTQPEFQRSAANPTPQTITEYSVSVINIDDSIVLEAAILSGNANNPTVVSTYVNGGTVGIVYELLYQAYTSAGVNIARTVLLPVDNL